MRYGFSFGYNFFTVEQAKASKPDRATAKAQGGNFTLTVILIKKL